jgi:two-component system cell cycle sensor histidine kinase/response regulator CckA
MPDVHLLVVDDDGAHRELVSQALREAGYTVTSAADGSEALALMDQHGPYAGYILDVVMPRMTGDELARCIRRLEPDARILYLTGYADALFERRQLLWQNEAFIEKPSTIAALLEAVSLMLTGSIRRAEETT